MAVSAEYLAKIRRAVRRGKHDEVDAELEDMIEECRADLVSVGVQRCKANNEADPLILGAIRCFVRWKFGIGNEESDRNREDYLILKDELRKKVEYCTSQTE